MAKDPVGEVVRNLFLLKRLENGVAAEVDALLAALFDDIAAQVQKLDPTAPPQQAYRRLRIQKLIGMVDGLSGATFAEIQKLVRQRAAEIGAQQAAFAEELLEASLGPAVGIDVQSGRVGVNMLKSIIDTDPIRGELMKDWFRGQSDGTTTRVRRQIQIGMAQGETVDDMVRRVRGRAVGRGRQMQFAGGVMQTTTRQAETIVRTSVQQIANTAHFRTYEANQDITTSWEYVNTLDRRTCLICAPLGGRTFRYDDEQAPRPIRHVRCRCVAVPVVDWAGLGLDPPPEGTRASATGQVPASTTYDEWLRAQPAEVQDEILGPGRAQLFRDGKVTLRDMVRDDGSIVRIEDLRGANGRPITPSDDPLEAARERLLPQVLADEQQIVQRQHEWARGWDPATGRRVLFGGDTPDLIEKTSGAPDYISFTPEERARLRGTIMTHNHPGGSPFSGADVRFAAGNDLYEIRAVGAGQTFSLRRPVGGWDTEAVKRTIVDYEKVVQGAYWRGQVELNRAIADFWEERLPALGGRYTITSTNR